MKKFVGLLLALASVQICADSYPPATKNLGVVDKVHCATAERWAMRYLDEDMIEQGITLTLSSLINATASASNDPDEHTALVYLNMYFVDMFRAVSEQKRGPGTVVEDFYDMCMKKHQGMYIQTYKY